MKPLKTDSRAKQPSFYGFDWTRGKGTYAEVGGYNGTDPVMRAIGHLERFPTRAERAAWVAEDEFSRESITRQEAVRMLGRKEVDRHE